MTTATLAKLAERGDIDPDERVVLVITGEGLKTLDAVRGTFESYEIAPSYDEFVEQVEGGARLMASRSSSRRSCAPPPAAQARDQRRRRDRRRGPRRRSTTQHGELRDRLSDDDGGLRRFVNVYVDGEDIRFVDGLRDAGRRRPARSRSCRPSPAADAARFVASRAGP